MTFTSRAGAVESRNGIRIVPDRATASWPADRLLPAVGQRKPAEALDQALAAIAARYGTRTAGVVAMQLEYPHQGRAVVRSPGGDASTRTGP